MSLADFITYFNRIKGQRIQTNRHESLYCLYKPIPVKLRCNFSKRMTTIFLDTRLHKDVKANSA